MLGTATNPSASHDEVGRSLADAPNVGSGREAINSSIVPPAARSVTGTYDRFKTGEE